MKKILFLLLCTVSIYGQTLQNPTFGNTTTNTIKVKTNSTSTTALDVGVLETDGSLNKMTPTNLPIPQVPLNYSVLTPNIGGHLSGIDLKLGALSGTTAGISTRVWFTADQTTITAGTFDLTNATSKGTAPIHQQTVANDDGQKKYFNTDLIGQPFAMVTTFPAGTYAGSLSASTTPTNANQKFTVELYRCNNAGTPIASGVAGAVTGSLGVTVIMIMDSGEVTLANASITNVPVSTNLGAGGFTINAGERIRYHVSAEKVGTAGGVINESVYYGSSYNSFIDVPVIYNSTSIKDVSTVTNGTGTVTEALNALNSTTDVKVSRGLISGDSTIAAYLGQSAIVDYLLLPSDIAEGNSLVNIAVPGHTIAQQKAAWLALSDKTSYDYVIVEIGLNDVGYTETDAVVIARLQDYITTINAGKKSDCKVIIGTMTPARQRWFDSYGATNGAIAQAQWFAINQSIMGFGSNPITGVNTRQNTHTIKLNDGLENLAGIYDMGDYIHENNLARQIIAGQYRISLNNLRFLKTTLPYDGAMYEYKGIKSYGTVSLPNNSAGIGFNAYSDGSNPRFIANGYSHFINTTNTGDFSIVVSNNNSLGYGATPTYSDAFYLNNRGDSGFGTKLPTNFGSLKNLSINGVDGSIIEFKKNDVINGYISSDINSLDIFNSISKPIKFITGGGERFKVDVTGVTVAGLAGTGTRQVVADASGNLLATTPQPLKYVALVAQTGSSAPTATVLENTLGGTIVWSRSAAGSYVGTLSGAFTLNKTFVIAATTNNGTILSTGYLSANTIYINTIVSNTGVLTDSILGSASLEVRIYP